MVITAPWCFTSCLLLYLKLKATSTPLIYLQVNLFILQDYIISSAYNRTYINSDQVTKQWLMYSFPSCKNTARDSIDRKVWVKNAFKLLNTHRNCNVSMCNQMVTSEIRE